MYPKLIFDKTNLPNFNPFEAYESVDDHHLVFPQELENMAAGERLPPLEDVNHKDLGQNSKTKSKSAYPQLTSPASLELLTTYRRKFMRSPESSTDEREPESDGKLSTVEILELAAEKFIKFSTHKVNGYTMFTHPYGSSAFTSLSMDETREVELVFQVLTAAEKVGRKQYELASKFLIRCGWVATETGTPVERLVYYLCEALQKRIGRETGIPVPTKLDKLGQNNENHMATGTNPTFLACHQALPFNQVLQFSGIQTIIDQIGTSNKVHLIDIHIRSGVQWTAMIQALADKKFQIELLKLTAFATPSEVQQVSETGKRLENFATSLSLPFVYKILVLSDITEVEEQQFEVQDGETVAVYCQMILRTLISRPNKLENLMRAIKTINPSIIVLAEVEANHNSTSFVNRFTEILFFYGALFDCLEVCMGRDDVHRSIVEGVHLADGMQNSVAAEGGDRVCRSVNMDTWRSFFVRFGMVELELSDSCVYQANLVLQQFSCASSCTLEKNGKCLIIGWKGTPLHSLSTWKFIRE